MHIQIAKTFIYHLSSIYNDIFFSYFMTFEDHSKTMLNDTEETRNSHFIFDFDFNLLIFYLFITGLFFIPYSHLLGIFYGY